MIIGTVNGETRRAPRLFRMSYWSSTVISPPMPLDTTAPSRSGSISGSPASLHASRAAISANC